MHLRQTAVIGATLCVKLAEELLLVPSCWATPKPSSQTSAESQEHLLSTCPLPPCTRGPYPSASLL